ncbi:MAG: DUF6230 family protein [Haloarculaceae archaeon]
MYNRKRIARGAGTAVAAWALVGLLVMSTGVAYAVPLAGIGGFTISADRITSDSMTLYHGVGDTSEIDAYPQAMIELTDAKMLDMRLAKTFDVNAIPGLSGTAKLRIDTDGQTVGDAVLVKSTAMSARGATFKQFAIEERNTTDPRTAFTMRADDGIVMQDAEIRAHYLATNHITLSHMSLVVCYNPDNTDNTYEYGPC